MFLRSFIRSLNNVFPGATTQRAIVFPSEIKFHLEGDSKLAHGNDVRTSRFNGLQYNRESSSAEIDLGRA